MLLALKAATETSDVMYQLQNLIALGHVGVGIFPASANCSVSVEPLKAVVEL